MIIKHTMLDEYKDFCQKASGTFIDDCISFAEKLGSALEEFMLIYPPYRVINENTERLCAMLKPEYPSFYSSDHADTCDSVFAFAIVTGILIKYWLFGSYYESWYSGQNFSFDKNPLV